MHVSLQTAAIRTLQHISHSAAAHHADHDHHDAEQHGMTMGSLQLRIIALFAILLGGLAGVVPPLCGRWMATPDGAVSRTVRGFSGGAILGLALPNSLLIFGAVGTSEIHIIPEGLEQLGSVSPTYPIGGIPVAAGLISLVFLDYLAAYVLTGRQLAKQQNQAKQRAAVNNLHACCPVSNSSNPGDKDEAVSNTFHDRHAVLVMPAEAASTAATGVTPFSHSHHHLPACQITTIKHYIACYSMELGCVFHSVIIGVSIGVVTSAPQLLVTMTVVMVFHQALEGLALGSILALTELSLLKKIVMCSVYALAMPLGVAVGIAVAGQHDPESLTNVVVQGVLNAVSGGMLLYVSLYHLLAEEFSKTDLILRPRLASVLAVAVVAGVASMCVIGIWG